MKRIALFVLTALAVFTLALSLAPRAAAQEEEPQQRLWVVYPDAGIVLSGKGEDAVTLRSVVHVEALPISPKVRKKHGDDPLVSEDLTCGHMLDLHLPVGKYEFHFSTRDGMETRTTVETVVLRPDGMGNLQVDFSKAKTYIIGDNHTIQQLEGAIGELARRLAALQAEVAALKGNPKAVTPAPAPTDTPAPAPTDAPAK